jgi:hypothetical protein
MPVRKFALGLIASLMTVAALAADVDGKWNASVDSPQGSITLVFEFKAEGEKLAGTMSAEMMPGAMPISDGVIKGNDVSFKLSLDLGQGGPPLVISYKGAVKGDEMNLTSTLDMGQGPMESPVVLKRAR